MVERDMETRGFLDKMVRSDITTGISNNSCPYKYNIYVFLVVRRCKAICF